MTLTDETLAKMIDGTWIPPGVKRLREDDTVDELHAHHEAESKALMAAVAALAAELREKRVDASAYAESLHRRSWRD